MQPARPDPMQPDHMQPESLADADTPVQGIAVHRAELLRWRDWLMPADQPFVVPRDEAASLGLPDGRDRLVGEVCDAFCIYGIGDAAVCWLDRRGSRRLARATRRSQPAPHRWPTDDVDADLGRVVAAVERGNRPSRHTEVPESVWAAATMLPAARALAGTFPGRSGPNCFGTVMGAAGIPGAEHEWMEQEPFDSWLAAHTSAGGDDRTPGTVMVWRDAEGLAQHAAVVLGGGWALHKRSQGWMSPTKVLGVRDLTFEVRCRGWHLQRHLLRP